MYTLGNFLKLMVFEISWNGKHATHNIYLLIYFSFLAHIVSGKKPILKSDISLGSGDAVFTIRLFCPLFTLKVRYTY